MKKIINGVIACTLSLLFHAAGAQTGPVKAVTAEKQAQLTPKAALKLLKQGNERFLNNQMRNYNYVKDMKTSTNYGQHPIALVFNCIDSRSIAETLFDQGIGSIFVSRIAGNVVDKDVLGGMEFATAVSGAPLIVVMGHTHCGAVRAACHSEGKGQGNLKNIFAGIKPAVQSVLASEDSSLRCDKAQVVDDIAKNNVVQQIAMIRQNSPVVMQLIKEKKVMVVGAMHDIKTGHVTFFDTHGTPL